MPNPIMNMLQPGAQSAQRSPAPSGNNMMQAFGQFMQMFRGKRPSERQMEQMLLNNLLQRNGISQDQLSQIMGMAKQVGMPESQIEQMKTFFNQHSDLVK